jgi:hypothetical protein
VEVSIEHLLEKVSGGLRYEIKRFLIKVKDFVNYIHLGLFFVCSGQGIDPCQHFYQEYCTAPDIRLLGNEAFEYFRCKVGQCPSYGVAVLNLVLCLDSCPEVDDLDRGKAIAGTLAFKRI